MTTTEAQFAMQAVGYRIFAAQIADDAEYARRAYERLRETRRVWHGPSRGYVYEPACTDPWEREVLERQVLRYVLDKGYFPTREHVKTYKANAAQAKREVPKKSVLKQAALALA
jgi:hypothetical protein